MAGTKTDSTGVTFPDATSQTTARTTSNTVTSFNGSVGAVSYTAVTSAVAGNGITVSGATGAVTVSLDGYNGSTRSYASYPVGTVVIVANSQGPVNGTISVWSANTNSGSVTENIFADSNQGSGSALLAGTWRRRGSFFSSCIAAGCLVTRTA